jgi:mannose-6-phosphate isomerase-like protein (cupin superfamily)
MTPPDRFEQKHIDEVVSNTANDGSTVFPLCRLSGKASTAVWALDPGKVSRAVSLRTTEEIWYVIAGGGAMWRRQDSRDETVELREGMSLTVPSGTAFQFRAAEEATLKILGVTIPPYPIGSTNEVVPEQGPWSARM